MAHMLGNDTLDPPLERGMVDVGLWAWVMQVVVLELVEVVNDEVEVVVVEQVRWVVFGWLSDWVPGTKATVELVPTGIVLNSTRGAVTVREDQVMVVQGVFCDVGAGVTSGGTSSYGAVMPGPGAVTVLCGPAGTSAGVVWLGGTISIISGFFGT
jgi:hypothetical protein